MSQYSKYDLITEVVVTDIRQRTIGASGDEALLRFDSLPPDCLTKIVNALAAASFANLIWFQIPRTLVNESDIVDSSVLTDLKAASTRNSDLPAGKVLGLTANDINDSSQDTLQDVEKIDEGQICRMEGWFESVNSIAQKQLSALFAGLLDGACPDLLAVEAFAINVNDLLTQADSKHTVATAVNASLHFIGLPRCLAELQKLLKTESTTAAAWSKYFAKIRRERKQFFLSTGRHESCTQEVLQARYELMCQNNPNLVDSDAFKAYALASQDSTESPLTDLLCFEWDQDCLREFVSKTSRPSAQTLTQVTSQFFQEYFNDVFSQPCAPGLTRSLEDFLQDLQDIQKSKQPTPECYDFYAAVQDLLKNAPKVNKAWDKFLYSDAIVQEDFVSGLMLAVDRLIAQESLDANEDYKVVISVRKAVSTLLGETNKTALAYFRTAYKGLLDYSDVIEWRYRKTKISYNPLLELEDQKRDRDIGSTSVSKDNLTIRFHIGLVKKSEPNEKPMGDVTVDWIFPNKGIIHGFVDDLKKLSAAAGNHLPFVFFANCNRTTNNKGAIQSVSLQSPKSLGTDGSGHLSYLLNYRVLANLTELFERECATADIAQDHPLHQAWESFFEHYFSAIKGLYEKGFGSDAIPVAHRAYCDLLRALYTLPDVSNIRKPLFALVTSIGVNSFLDISNHYAVVAPWHPLRLYSLHCRFVSRLALISQRLHVGKNVNIGAKSLFMDHLTEAHPDYFDPQVVIMPSSVPQDRTNTSVFHADWQLLLPSETKYGYTLYHSLDDGKNVRRQQVGASQSSIDAVTDAISAYLKLYPHEKDNFIVALPDAYSGDFPVALGKQLFKTYLADEDKAPVKGARFVLKAGSLIANDKENHLYEDLNGGLVDTQEFKDSALMADSIGARLRIQVDGSQKFDCRDSNIAQLESLVLRHAELRWQSVELKIWDPMNLSVMPEFHNRRYFDYRNPDVAKTFVVTPLQTEGGAAYLRTLTQNLKNSDDLERNLQAAEIDLPALSVSTSGEDFHGDLAKVHSMADWVIICSNLLDKRQLLERDINVVRYKVDSKRRGVELISSNLQMEMLTDHVENVIRSLMGTCIDNQDLARKQLALKLLKHSYGISGYIALRAARRENNARELVGLCLSDFVASNIAKKCARDNGETVMLCATYLLDDYASWFGAGSIADLLVIAVSRDASNRTHVHLVVTESKFCCDNIMVTEAAQSRNQLESTVQKLVNAFRADSDFPFDCAVWCDRLADLVLDTPKEFYIDLRAENALEAIKELSDDIRNASFDLTVNGISHVFVYDRQEKPSRTAIDSEPDGRMHQDISWKLRVQALLKNFADDNEAEPMLDATEIRLRGLDLCRSNPLLYMAASPISPNAETGTVESSDADSFEPENTVAEEPSEEGHNASQTAPASGNSTADAPASAGSEEAPRAEQLYAPSFQAFVNMKANDSGYSEERRLWADNASRMLREKLVQKHIDAIELSHVLTPNGCLVRFRGADSLTTKAISAIEENLLTTASLEIIFAQPAAGEFQILLKSPTREAISMWSIWKKRNLERNKAGVNLSFAIGLKEEDNEILYLNPVKQDPHTLVAGGTGSGKTVLVQMLLLDIAATNPSSLMKFYLIDPKRSVDYCAFERLPHLAAAPISEKNEAMDLLTKLVEEMNRRLDLFRAAGAKNLERYNAKFAKEKRLPVLWLVHDEFAAWMVDKDYADKIQEVLTVLAVQARATGIYIILIAQRPDKDVMPMQIRDNLGNRLALKLPTEQSSVIALGRKGAEVLLGKGHLAAKLSNAVVYAQVPFLDEEEDEIELAVEKIAEADQEWS